jgi:hypothetical protein
MDKEKKENERKLKIQERSITTWISTGSTTRTNTINQPLLQTFGELMREVFLLWSVIRWARNAKSPKNLNVITA